ncbi:hypothetical protein LTR66_001422 [Elasticomyces elasticus]|nr:hypothetical protein LTR66_001422 [Elasticomyces elasticus]
MFALAPNEPLFDSELVSDYQDEEFYNNQDEILYRDQSEESCHDRDKESNDYASNGYLSYGQAISDGGIGVTHLQKSADVGAAIGVSANRKPLTLAVDTVAIRKFYEVFCTQIPESALTTLAGGQTNWCTAFLHNTLSPRTTWHIGYGVACSIAD